MPEDEQHQRFKGMPHYGSGVRDQVFQVIVRQALTGAPWRDICAGPMLVNYITPEEIEDELRRIRGDDGPSAAFTARNPINPAGEGSSALPLPTETEDGTDGDDRT